MLIDYESIIILNGEAATDIISGSVRTEIIQKSAASGFTENSFTRNNAVIQCISPSVSDGTAKVKLSVMYRPAVSLEFEYASFVLDRPADTHAEVRCQNETVFEGDCTVSSLRISPSSEEGKLELVFECGGDSREDEIAAAVSEIKNENQSLENDIAQLENQLLEENSRTAELELKKHDTAARIDMLRAENEKTESAMRELAGLEEKNEVLRKNYEEMDCSTERVTKLRKQLEGYEEILSYYRDDEGYITVSEKLDRILEELRMAEEGISALAQKRSEEE